MSIITLDILAVLAIFGFIFIALVELLEKLDDVKIRRKDSKMAQVITTWVKAHPGIEVSFEFGTFDDCLIVTMFHREPPLKFRKWITGPNEAFMAIILDQMYDEIMDKAMEMIKNEKEI